MSRHKLMDREKRRFIARELAHGIKGTGKELVFEDWVDEISVTLSKAERNYYTRPASLTHPSDSVDFPGFDMPFGGSNES